MREPIQNEKDGRMKGSTGFHSVDELYELIDDFFDNRPEKVDVRVRGGVELADNMTQSALARHLGYKTKRSMDASLRHAKDEDRREVLTYIRERFIEYWEAYSQLGDNPTIAKFILGCYGVTDNPNNAKHKIDLEGCDTELQQAGRILMAGAKGEIEPSVVTSMINAVKAKADIKKTSELEEMVNQLAEIAGIKS